MSADRLYEYDEKQAARILDVTARTLRRWRKDGKVSFYRTPGGRVRYSTDQLLELRRSSRVPVSSPIAS